MINILMIEDDSDIAKLLSLVLLQHDIISGELFARKRT